jgi:hypothetical protein
MTDAEKISELEIKSAILSEKVSRLEIVIYGVCAFVLLQLFGLFILWVEQVVSKQ